MLKEVTLGLARASGVLHLIRNRYAGPGAILMFHEIHDAGDRELRTGVTQDFLDRTIRWLRLNGWDIVSLDECERRLTAPGAGRFAVLTFDDGYRDNLKLALPVLERHNAPFTIYVPTGAIDRTLVSWWLGLRQLCRENDALDIEPMGRRFVCDTVDTKADSLDAICKWVHQDYTRKASLNAIFSKANLSFGAINDAYFMNARELRELAQHPLATIGGHTRSHAAIATLDAPAALEEMTSNRTYLADLVQQDVRHFAFPYGNRNACGPRDFTLARTIGFKSAVTTQDEPLSFAPDVSALPRIGVRNNDTFVTLDGRISGLRKAVNNFRKRTAAQFG